MTKRLLRRLFFVVMTASGLTSAAFRPGETLLPRSAEGASSVGARGFQPAAERLGKVSGARPRRANPKKRGYWVKIGDMKTEPRHKRLVRPLVEASRQALAELPGVRILDDEVDAEQEATKSHRPVVVVSGQLRELGSARVGTEVVMSAKVEYLIYRVPGRLISAVVAGTAKTRVDAAQVKNPADRKQLEVDLVHAAVESAARRAPSAFEAALK